MAAAPVLFCFVSDPNENTDPTSAAVPAQPAVPAPPADPTPDTDPTPDSDGAASTLRSVPYKGADLDSERGPGLGCFRFQVIALAALIVLTPIGVNAGWPDWLTATLLFVTIALLLVTGQTIIFLLRLVAADRRGRRRPLASGTKTVGELEDAGAETEAEATTAQPPATGAGDGDSAMRQ